jgi:hypothetical protein
MAVTSGVLARLEAKPGKSDELAAFFGAKSPPDEEGTVTWYAFRVGENSFGIFDTFEDQGAATRM